MDGANAVPVVPLLGLQEILERLLCGLVLSLLVALLYRTVRRGPSQTPHMAPGIVLIALLITMVLMVIGNSLARAFGLVGALSIIRFRTPVKDLRDILFLFFGIALGIASGVGAFRVAAVSTLAIGGVVLLLDRLGFGRRVRGSYLLKISTSLKQASREGTAAHEAVLARHARSYRALEVSSPGQDGMDILYDVAFPAETEVPGLLAELRALPQVERVYLLSAEQDPDLP